MLLSLGTEIISVLRLGDLTLAAGLWLKIWNLIIPV